MAISTLLLPLAEVVTVWSVVALDEVSYHLRVTDSLAAYPLRVAVTVCPTDPLVTERAKSGEIVNPVEAVLPPDPTAVI